MATEFSLRPATEDDFSEIMKIEKQVHLAPWTEQHFRDELIKPYSSFMVLSDDETDSVIAGYIVCWQMFDEIQILNIVVNLPFRGLGFAKQMLRKVILLANKKDVKRIVLDVRKSNIPAFQLYQGLNFFITHIRKQFYSNGEDAYQMALTLQDEELTP